MKIWLLYPVMFSVSWSDVISLTNWDPPVFVRVTSEFTSQKEGSLSSTLFWVPQGCVCTNIFNSFFSSKIAYENPMWNSSFLVGYSQQFVGFFKKINSPVSRNKSPFKSLWGTFLLLLSLASCIPTINTKWVSVLEAQKVTCLKTSALTLNPNSSDWPQERLKSWQ